MRLGEMKPGMSGRVLRLDGDGALRVRLLEMGLTPGHARSGLPRGAPGRPAGAAPARLFAFPAARGRHARGNGGNMTLALLGNPNSGKTTLFNAMTGMRSSGPTSRA